MGKMSKSAFGLPVGSSIFFIESLPRPAKCTKKKRYSQPGTFIYPEPPNTLKS